MLRSSFVSPVLRATPKGLAVLCLAAIAGSTFADVKNGNTEDKTKPGFQLPFVKRPKPEKIEPIPEAVSATVKFAVGKSTVIDLTASVGSTRQVYFVVRDQPENGILSPIRAHPKDSNKAQVTYTHKGGEAPTLDHFTFACHVEGGPMSNSADVTLFGQKLEPKLEVTDSPRFAKSFVGGEMTGKVSVKNGGDAPFSQDITWPEPWSGPKHLDIKPGQDIEFELTFRPSQPGFFRLEQELQPGTGTSKVITFAECERNLTLAPTVLLLTENPKSGGREGTVTLLNNRDGPLTVKLTLPSRLKGSNQIALEPHERRDVTFNMAEGDVETFHGDLSIDADGDHQVVSVQSGAKQGELKLLEPSTPELQLGNVTEKSETSSSFVLKNTGGQPIAVQALAYPPLSLDTRNTAFRLEPNQQRSIQLKLTNPPPGAYSGVVKIQSSGAELNLSVLAQIATPLDAQPANTGTNSPATPMVTIVKPRTETPTRDASKFVPPNLLGQIYQGLILTEGMPIPEFFINSNLEKVEDITVNEHSSTSCTISWKRPAISPASWLIQVSSYGVDRIVVAPNSKTHEYVRGSGMAFKDWQNFKEWSPTDIGPDRVGARLRSLRPSHQYEFRVLAVDRDGKVSQPSPRLKVNTDRPWRVPYWVWQLLAALGMGGALYFLHRLRRGDFSEVLE